MKLKRNGGSLNHPKEDGDGGRAGMSRADLSPFWAKCGRQRGVCARAHPLLRPRIPKLANIAYATSTSWISQCRLCHATLTLPSTLSGKPSHANFTSLVLIITSLALCPLFLVLDNLAIMFTDNVQYHMIAFTKRSQAFTTKDW